MNKCKLVLFDMDGVTLDTEPLYANGENKLFEEYGVKIPKEDWKLFRGCTEEKFYDLSMKKYGITEKRTIFQEKGRAYIKKEFEEKLAFMNGFEKLVGRLKENSLKIGLVTASPEHMFNWVNKRIKLTEIFEKIVHGGMTKKSKPDPEPYLLAMKQFNIKSSNTMIIEDSVHGILAGLNSGSRVVALTGSVDIEDMPPAHRIINSLNDIDHVFIKSIFDTI